MSSEIFYKRHFWRTILVVFAHKSIIVVAYTDYSLVHQQTFSTQVHQRKVAAYFRLYIPKNLTIFINKKAMIESGEKMNRNEFQWSLKPLSTCLKFVGVPLNFSSTKINAGSVKFVVIFVVIVMANLSINGPRGVEVIQLDFMKQVRNFDSPHLYFKANPFGLIKLVRVISGMIFFCYVPVIHFAFMTTVLCHPSWKKLIVLLEKIQMEMKLDEKFHKKCRRQCYLALVYLLVVSRLEIHFK